MGRWQVFDLAASLFFLFRRIKKRQEKSLKTDVFRQIMVRLSEKREKEEEKKEVYRREKI